MGKYVNIKKDLILMVERVYEKADKYTPKMLDSEFTISGDKYEMRVNIGHVFRANFR